MNSGVLIWIYEVIVAHGLNFRKAHSNGKEFENMRPTMQDNLLST